MSTAWLRLGEKASFSLIVTVVLIIVLTWFPNYEKLSHSMMEPVNEADYEYVGFPAGEAIPVLETAMEIDQERSVYTIEVDASRMVPLRVFSSLAGEGITDSRAPRVLCFDDFKKMMAQYYAVELDDGEKVLCLIDDFAVKIPGSGRIKLPIGRTEVLGKTSKKYLSRQAGILEGEFSRYVNMVGSWRHSQYAAKGRTIRMMIIIGCFLVVAPFVYWTVWRLERKERRKF